MRKIFGFPSHIPLLSDQRPFLLELQRVEPERTLTDSQRDEFEDMLRALTLERSLIKEAMGFALDNADAAGEVMLAPMDLDFCYYLCCFLIS